MLCLNCFFPDGSVINRSLERDDYVEYRFYDDGLMLSEDCYDFFGYVDYNCQYRTVLVHINYVPQLCIV